LTVAFTQPLAKEFHRRFREEKKAHGHYLGFKDFDRCCRAKTGYTGQCIRNYEAGNPTPAKHQDAKPLSAAEKKFRADAKILQAEVDAAVEAKLHTSKLSEIESRGAAALVPSVPPAVPVVITSPQKNLVAAADKTALEEAIQILRNLIFNVNRKLFLKPHFKEAVAFLKTHGAFEVPPPPHRKRKPLAIKSVSADSVKDEAPQGRPLTDDQIAELKQEVIAGTKTLVADGEHFPIKDKYGKVVGQYEKGTHLAARMISENSKGTGGEIYYYPEELHESMKRGAGVV
jgi:hypothetical protein